MKQADDPRALRSRHAVLAAARVLLREEGPAAVTHQRVAAAAGIGRATIYRHWPSPPELLLAVMGEADLPFFQHPSTPVRPWLHQQLRRLADELALPDVAVVALTLLHQAQWNPQLAQQRDRFLDDITQRLIEAIALAVDSGELDGSLTGRDAAAVLVGPVLLQATTPTFTVSEPLLEALLDTLGTWRG